VTAEGFSPRRQFDCVAAARGWSGPLRHVDPLSRFLSPIMIDCATIATTVKICA